MEIPTMATPLGKYAQLTLSEELVSEHEVSLSNTPWVKYPLGESNLECVKAKTCFFLFIKLIF